MPDTFENKNSRLEDKAWSDMSKRLDLAMPPKRGISNREWILLMILFLVIISFGSYVAFLRNDLEDDKEQKIISEELLIASKPIMEQNTPVENMDQTNSDPDLNIEKSNDLNSNTSESFTYNKTTGYSNKVLDNSNKTIQANNLQLLKKSDNTEEEQNIALSEFSSNLQKNADTENSVTNVVRKLFTPKRLMRDIPAIESVAGIEYFSLAPEYPLQAQSIQKFLPGICRNVFSANAAIFSENLQSFGGLELGLGHMYNLNRNFGISYGLRFQVFYKEGFRNTLALTNFSNSFAPHLHEGEFDDLSEYRYVYDVQNSEIVENQVGVEYLMGIVDKLYYVSLPVNIHFNWKRISIYGGANASFLLRGTNQVRDYSDQYFNTVILSEHVLEKRNYYNRVDIGFQVGLEYRIWREVIIYGRYNYGTLEILNSGSGSETNEKFVDRFAYGGLQALADRVDFNRHFTLGLKVNLNQCR